MVSSDGLGISPDALENYHHAGTSPVISSDDLLGRNRKLSSRPRAAGEKNPALAGIGLDADHNKVILHELVPLRFWGDVVVIASDLAVPVTLDLVHNFGHWLPSKF